MVELVPNCSVELININGRVGAELECGVNMYQWLDLVPNSSMELINTNQWSELVPNSSALSSGFPVGGINQRGKYAAGSYGVSGSLKH